MTKEELKVLIAEATEKAKAEAKEQGLDKEATKKYVADAVAKVKEANPVADEPKEKVYLVETPVKNFSGIVAGVHFAYGKAEVKAGWILDWFKEKGYKVTEVK